MLLFPLLSIAAGYLHGFAWRLVCHWVSTVPRVEECGISDLWDASPMYAVLYYASALLPLALLYNMIWRTSLTQSRRGKLRHEFGFYVGPSLALAGVVFTALVTGDAIWDRARPIDFLQLVAASIAAGLVLLYLFWGVAVRMSAVASDMPGPLDRAAARLFAHSPFTIGIFLAFFASIYGDQALGETTVGALAVVASDLVVIVFIGVVEVAMSFILLPDSAEVA